MNEKELEKELRELKKKLKRLISYETVAVIDEEYKLRREIPIKEAKLEAYKQGQQDVAKKLKIKVNNLYKKLPKVEVWNASKDVVCDMCEEKVLEIIDKLLEGEDE